MGCTLRMVNGGTPRFRCGIAPKEQCAVMPPVPWCCWQCRAGSVPMSQGSRELLTQTWQVLGESRLSVKVLQPCSPCAMGMPCEDEGTAHTLPTCSPGTHPAPPTKPGAGAAGRRWPWGSLAAQCSLTGPGASPAKELTVFTPHQPDERPCSLSTQRLQGSITAITSRSQTGCRQGWSKSLLRVQLCHGKERSAWAWGGG